MKFKIKQIKDLKNCDYSFEHYDWCKDKINLNDYGVVYEGEVSDEDASKGNNYVLEMLFTKFNIAHPEDYKGRSLSVSDIVELDGKNYYCDAFGWVELKEE